MIKKPNHIAIVMDGNGRWAENKGLLRVEGHRAGVQVVKTVIECCIKQQIPILSLFAFSSENWLRPEFEVEFLMQLFLQSLQKELQELHQEGIRLKFIGALDQLSEDLQAQIKHAELLTADNQRLMLNIAVNYSGRWDILQAVQRLFAEKSQEGWDESLLDENLFKQYLSTSELPDPDLLIRTSGEVRISNFFLWQLAYTELFFTPIHWPDFSEKEFNLALEHYENRERRFGQLSTQLPGI